MYDRAPGRVVFFFYFFFPRSDQPWHRPARATQMCEVAQRFFFLSLFCSLTILTQRPALQYRTCIRPYTG